MFSDVVLRAVFQGNIAIADAVINGVLSSEGENDIIAALSDVFLIRPLDENDPVSAWNTALVEEVLKLIRPQDALRLCLAYAPDLTAEELVVLMFSALPDYLNQSADVIPSVRPVVRRADLNSFYDAVVQVVRVVGESHQKNMKDGVVRFLQVLWGPVAEWPSQTAWGRWVAAREDFPEFFQADVLASRLAGSLDSRTFGQENKQMLTSMLEGILLRAAGGSEGGGS